MHNNNQSIISEAKKLIGVSFSENGRSEDSGYDCIGLIIHIAHKLKLRSISNRLELTKLDVTNYNYRIDSKKMIEICDIHFKNIVSFVEGAILIFSFSITHHHIAIISKIFSDPYDGLGLNLQINIIHSCNKVGSVVEHSMPNRWKNYISRIYLLDD